MKRTKKKQSEDRLNYLSPNAHENYPNFEGNLSWGCDSLYKKIKELQKKNDILLKKNIELERIIQFNNTFIKYGGILNI